MDKCTYCGSNDWISNGHELTPVFWKDHSGGQIHLKCLEEIEANPDTNKVKIWKMLEYIEGIDFVKTTAYTPESLQLLVMDKMNITQEMVDLYNKEKQ